jgi:topoisomerase IA-like protein
MNVLKKIKDFFGVKEDIYSVNIDEILAPAKKVAKKAPAKKVAKKAPAKKVAKKAPAKKVAKKAPTKKKAK